MKPNALFHETSPYLQQHALNPVAWVPWRPDHLERAKKENKLLLISIGYAACHWCHVMEHECFEDEATAEVMNTHFINIKVDREERPDVDQIYMDALQMMTGSGGWPLNIVALPDGRPFWGATYVPKQKWNQVLQQLARLYKSDPEKILAYANDLSKGIHAINLPNLNPEPTLTRESLQALVGTWMKRFDPEYGGYLGAPKFMMPTALNFLLHYYMLYRDAAVLEHLNLTLTKMAYGGLFDQLGGGFSRYSVDPRWHVPHFEKMLYDNGQLLETYSIAYQLTGNTLYREVVLETWRFIREELQNPEGGFYASLDADSLDQDGNLEEGAFYVWTEVELQALLGDDYPLFAEYYNVNDFGLWEHENYVLIRTKIAEEIADAHNIDISELQERINSSRAVLLGVRAQRPKPRLDNKVITSWNAMVIKGLAEASRYLKAPELLNEALRAATYVETHIARADGGLYHTISGDVKKVNGFAEDYAWCIDAYIALYQASLEEKWLIRAKDLLGYCLSRFQDPKSGLFYFTSDEDAALIRRSYEKEDNVIPSSNALLARSLFQLHQYFPEEGYRAHYDMIRNHIPEPGRSFGAYTQWMRLHLMELFPFRELVVLGTNFKEVIKPFQKDYMPQTLLAGNDKEGNMPLFKHRLQKNMTLIYLCENGACNLPEADIEKVRERLTSSLRS